MVEPNSVQSAISVGRLPGAPATLRTHGLAYVGAARAIERRITVIWGLLFFNVLAWIDVPTILPIPQRAAQVLTMGALALALLLTLTINRSLVIRPNVFLTLFTVLAMLSFVSSVRGEAGVGALFRCARLSAFLVVLWLLTPWWGRRDLLIARCHLRALLVVCSTVVLGALIAPSLGFSVGGRLTGALWPIWPTAVAHFAAVATGLVLVSWFSGLLRAKPTALLALPGLAMVLLSQTRIAMVGLVAGVTASALTLLLVRRRVRQVAVVALAAVPVAGVALAPAISAWFTRGQSSEELANLTGRRQVWDLLLNAPRSEFTQWFGHGLSDKGFAGLPIDNSWLAIYHDQGLVAAALVGTLLILLILMAVHRGAGPARALAVFIVVFATVDSYTEVGLGDASPYLLDLAVAASLLVTDHRWREGMPAPVDRE
ncbi:MAG: O-antigen ligase domain-containing protein [Actinomycetota bacterium]|nr:O-antigen ligase domain-containing protein [Actinomycetota bacterium]